MGNLVYPGNLQTTPAANSQATSVEERCHDDTEVLARHARQQALRAHHRRRIDRQKSVSIQGHEERDRGTTQPHACLPLARLQAREGAEEEVGGGEEA